jgi:hypothetical protein
MILLEGSIHKLKLDFNKRIIDLRIRKKQHKSEIENKNERIHQINDKLGLKETLFAPTIDEKIEEPENFFLVSDKEVSNYKVELKAREDAAKNKNTGKSNKKKQEEKNKEDAKKKQAEEEKKKNEVKEEVKEEVIDPYMRQLPDRKNRIKVESELDREMKQVEMIQL